MSGIVLAGTHSGCGKTTIALGLIAALKKKSLSVRSFKAGPDFIDSGLHSLITGSPSINLDLWICGEDYVKDCYLKNSKDTDISIVEGVMGLYDGKLSTAKLADTLGLPVILVIDAYGMAESAGAIVQGFTSYSPEERKSGRAEVKNSAERNSGLPEFRGSELIQGVIFNRVGSEKHFNRLRESVADVPVLGYLPRDLNFEIPHRHLGLTTAEDDPISEENIQKLADTVLKFIDIEQIIETSKTGSRSEVSSKELYTHSLITHHSSPPVIAVAYDRAFCFYYEDNLTLLRDEGAEIIFFSPLSDPAIPEGADCIYIGGGYPELQAEGLSQNARMISAIRNWSELGRPLYAECGGLMYLSKGIHDFQGNFFSMAGIFPFETEMRRGRPNLGYREVFLKRDSILGSKGKILRGHEFHYSSIRTHPPLEENSLEYEVKDSSGEILPDEGYRSGQTIASYIHIHFGSNPETAGEFINSIRNER
jgi:cobyrinic acid a,c-diamide synthase